MSNVNQGQYNQQGVPTSPLIVVEYDGNLVGPGSTDTEVLPAGWSAVHADPVEAATSNQGWTVTHNLNIPLNKQKIECNLVRVTTISGASIPCHIQNKTVNSFQVAIGNLGATDLDATFCMKVFV